jgi:mRNA interferase MazF
LGASGPLAGLSAPSVIRPCKIATIDAGDVQPLGRIDDDVLGEVMGTLRACLGIGVA